MVPCRLLPAILLSELAVGWCAAGTAIPGFTLEECPPIVCDRIEHVVAWKGGKDVRALAGRPVRLRFVMRDSDLYALRFR